MADCVMFIPLVRDRQIAARALVDAEDYVWLMAPVQGKAHPRWRLDYRGYAVWSTMRDKRPLTLNMARLILGLTFGDGFEADHINRDKLDNRRANLRTVTHAQQMQNLPALGGTSQHRGVYWDASRGKWSARVQINRKTHFLGRFEREEDAVRAAADFRREHMPFAEAA